MQKHILNTGITPGNVSIFCRQKKKKIDIMPNNNQPRDLSSNITPVFHKECIIQYSNCFDNKDFV